MKFLNVTFNYDAASKAVTKVFQTGEATYNNRTGEIDFTYTDAPAGQNAAQLTQGGLMIFKLGTGWGANDYLSEMAIGHIDNGVSSSVTTWSPPDGMLVQYNNANIFQLYPDFPNFYEDDGGEVDFTLVANSISRPTTLALEDMEALASGEDAYTYAISVQTDTGAVSCDPEVVNKTGSDEPQWGEPIPVTTG